MKENDYQTLYDNGKYKIERSNIIFKYTPHIDNTVYEFSGIQYKKYLTKSNELVFISVERDEHSFYTIIYTGEECKIDKDDNISYKNNAQFSYQNKSQYSYGNENSIANYLKIIAWGYLWLSILTGLIIMAFGLPGVLVGIGVIFSGIVFHAFFLGISEIIKLLAKKNK